MSVLAFGDFEHPRYSATVDMRVPGAKANGWCCDIGRGHKTPQAAAQHAARLAASEWRTPEGDR